MKQMQMNKKIIAVVAAALLACLMVGGATMALLTTSSGTLTNTFTVAAVDTEIEEIIDGMTKMPYVKNTGTADCLVRVKVTITPSDSKISLDYQTEAALKEAGLTGTAWEQGSDGYWYYQGILEAASGTETSKTDTSVFTTVTWTGNSDYSDFEEFDIIVYQEAVQVWAQDADGNTISAVNDNGSYNAENAKKIWSIYDNASEYTEADETVTE